MYVCIVANFRCLYSLSVANKFAKDSGMDIGQRNDKTTKLIYMIVWRKWTNWYLHCTAQRQKQKQEKQKKVPIESYYNDNKKKGHLINHSRHKLHSKLNPPFVLIEPILAPTKLMVVTTQCVHTYSHIIYAYIVWDTSVKSKWTCVGLDGKMTSKGHNKYVSPHLYI